VEQISPQPKRSERGQSLVELGMSMVVLLILLAGIADFGRAIFTYISMRDAAQEAVIYGSMYPYPCSRIRARALQTIDNNTSAIVDVRFNGKTCETATASDACLGKEIKVNIIYPDFQLTTPFFAQTIQIRSTVSGTMLRPACP
jgi:hypothetical protein